MTIKAVFLDRDGVLNANLVRDHKPYAPRSLADFHLLPGVPAAVRRIKELGLLAIVATNQPDVAQGLTPQSVVEEMHTILRRDLPLDGIEVCWHGDVDGCACRKPKPGMLLTAAARYGIDLNGSYMVGDRWRDVLAGQAAGCFTLFIDYNFVQERSATADRTVSSLTEAVEFIAARETGSR